MTETSRPLPVVTDRNRPFFDGLARGELRLQRCTACRHLRYPIASLCPACLGRDAEWELLSGRARVHSTVVFHRVYDPEFAADVPYNVSIVQLEEGPLMMTNVVGADPSSVAVGDAVRLEVATVGPDAVIPRFVPADA